MLTVTIIITIIISEPYATTPQVSSVSTVNVLLTWCFRNVQSLYGVHPFLCRERAVDRAAGA